jgi:hypothetical protein
MVSTDVSEKPQGFIFWVEDGDGIFSDSEYISPDYVGLHHRNPYLNINGLHTTFNSYYFFIFTSKNQQKLFYYTCN